MIPAKTGSRKSEWWVKEVQSKHEDKEADEVLGCILDHTAAGL